MAGVRLAVGELPGALPDSPEQVALLPIDLNNALPEQAVVHFWPRLVPGAVLIYDEYGYPGCEASDRAADELSAELGSSILASPTGQGIVVNGSESPRRSPNP